MRRRLTIGLLLLLIGTVAAPGASGGSVAMRDHLTDHGFNEDQIDSGGRESVAIH